MDVKHHVYLLAAGDKGTGVGDGGGWGVWLEGAVDGWLEFMCVCVCRFGGGGGRVVGVTV